MQLYKILWLENVFTKQASEVRLQRRLQFLRLLVNVSHENTLYIIST